MSFKKSILCFVFTLITAYSVSQSTTHYRPKFEPPETRILFIFDASLSMSGFWKSDKKVNIARNTMIKIIDSLEYLENVQMALRLYGHQSPVPPQNCHDTKLEVPFGPDNAARIRQELRFISPKGTTPIAYSIEMGAKDFPSDCPDCRNIIILITDGVEECEGDPCEVSYNLQKQGIVLKPFVIGIGIDEGFKKTFDCIGHYYNVENEENFDDVMEVVISQALNQTTAQVNLLDIYGNPSETNVNMTFYDQFSGKIRYNFIHTINHRGKPDTLVLDHLLTYKMKVHTLPPVEIDNIKLFVGKHTIIGADAPQGTLLVKVEGGGQYRDLEYIVRKEKSMKTLNIQKINEEEKYIVGKYDLEIPTLPRIYQYGVEINQSTTTTVTIPRPGLVTLLKASPGYGSIYVRRNNDEEWICNINNNIKNETVVLQPGYYRVVFRAQNAKQTLYTINKTFLIKPGGNEVIQFY